MARIIIIDDEDRKIELGSAQVSVITHALSVAAERFDGDAKVFGEIIALEDEKAASQSVEPAESEKDKAGNLVIRVPIITRQGAVQLREQFERQARDTRGVLAIVEGYEDEPVYEEHGAGDPDRERFGGQG